MNESPAGESADDPGPRPEDPARSIHIDDPLGRLSAAQASWLEGAAKRALDASGARGEVRIRIVDDAEMATAHRRHCGVEGTTDVITFDLRSEPGESEGQGANGALDTDLLVCADEAERQSSLRGITPEREILLYIIHGVLHCLGYDDHDEDASHRMHEREDEILAAIGVGATYALPPGERRERAVRADDATETD